MEILEKRDEWFEEFQTTWLAHYSATGEIDWSRYRLPRNRSAPASRGIDLSQSRLVLISSAGGYLRGTQEPFDAENDLGDYDIRTFPINSAPSAIAFAHTHCDHAAVNADQQVLLPLAHLRDLVDEGVIGELAPDVINFMGYQPDATRVVDETIPAIVEAARSMRVDGALLVPS